MTGLMMCSDISKNNQSYDNFSILLNFDVVYYFIYYQNNDNLKRQCIDTVLM